MKSNHSIIRDENSYNTALKRIEQIFDSIPGTEEYEELELLVLLVENYEDTIVKIPELDPIDLINYILEENDLKQKDLVGILGDKTNVSKVLNRKRPLTLEMIRNFSKRFKIPADLLINEYDLLEV